MTFSYDYNVCFIFFMPTATKPSTDCRLPKLWCKTMRLRHIQVPERRGRRPRNTRYAWLCCPRSIKLRTNRRANRHVVRYTIYAYDRHYRFVVFLLISLYTFHRSIGVLMYVLLTGCSPFGGDTKQETFCNISQCKLDFPEDLFQDISEDAIDLMKKLMVKNPR